MTNAITHFGKEFTLSVDIKDFFDSITRSHLISYLDQAWLYLILEDGAPRQGLPTSPVTSNIAMLSVDKRMSQLSATLGISYSRYADDLTFGFDDPSIRSFLINRVRHILADYGLSLNERKSHFQNAKNGSLIITGVALTKEGVFATRKTLRKLRASLHQGNDSSAKGLAEWAKCHLPKSLRPNDRKTNACDIP